VCTCSRTPKAPALRLEQAATDRVRRPTTALQLRQLLRPRHPLLEAMAMTSEQASRTGQSQQKEAAWRCYWMAEELPSLDDWHTTGAVSLSPLAMAVASAVLCPNLRSRSAPKASARAFQAPAMTAELPHTLRGEAMQHNPRHLKSLSGHQRCCDGQLDICSEVAMHFGHRACQQLSQLAARQRLEDSTKKSARKEAFDVALSWWCWESIHTHPAVWDGFHPYVWDVVQDSIVD